MRFNINVPFVLLLAGLESVLGFTSTPFGGSSSALISRNILSQKPSTTDLSLVSLQSTTATAPSEADVSASPASTLDLSAWETELTLDEMKELLKTAEQAAREAGKVIRSHTGCCSELEEECEVKFNIKDVVTEYDKQAQDAIVDIVTSKFPSHSFLGEEDVESGGIASEQALTNILQSSPTGYIWIADPIDGTANFASGLALSAVTMGVVYKGTPIVGVVYDPHADEMFSAIKGQGAALNGEPLSTAMAVDEAKDAIINAGCPADPNAFETSMRGVLALNSRCRGIRIIACSALTTAWIAAGRLTAHFGYDLSSWDLVAGTTTLRKRFFFCISFPLIFLYLVVLFIFIGALLIQEAGGRVTDLDGTPYKLETRNMLCSNSFVHDEVLGILSDADAVSFTRSTN